MMGSPLNIISLGAGVQSTVMSLMAAHGEITPMPDAAIFADTQAEPLHVYEHLDWLESVLPFPVYRVTAGNLRADELRVRTSAKSGRRYLKNSIPAFVKQPDGKVGLLGRRCTSDYKIIPLQRKVKQLVGIKRATKDVRAIMWIGISTDEAHRMKPSRATYIENRHPLIEYDMSRSDCIKWMHTHGYPTPPRSACTFCPFHSDMEWDNLKTNHPHEYADVLRFEEDLQEAARNQEVLRGVPFLHKSCRPLSDVSFSSENINYQYSLFGNECEGLCGI